jgi:hypothetical protein
MDYELGYTFDGGLFRFGVNAYYMDYKDQFVQTGEVSDIGENLTTNIRTLIARASSCRQPLTPPLGLPSRVTPL